MQTINISDKRSILCSKISDYIHIDSGKKMTKTPHPEPWPYLFLLPLQFFHSDLPCLCPCRSLCCESCFSLQTGTQQWNKSWITPCETHLLIRARNKETRLGKTVNTSVGVNSLLQVMALPSITCYASQAGNTPLCRHYTQLEVVFKSALHYFNYCSCGQRGNRDLFKKGGFYSSPPLNPMAQIIFYWWINLTNSKHIMGHFS